jgi:transposase
MSAKNDARKLDQSTQAHLRKMVVQVVRNGMTQVAAARTYRVSLRAISRWMKTAREGGLRSLKSGKRGRRPGSGHPTHWQAVRIRKLLIERMPDQLSMPFYLWTRIGRATDRKGVRHQGVEVDCRSILEGVGHERAEAGATSL